MFETRFKITRCLFLPFVSLRNGTKRQFISTRADMNRKLDFILWVSFWNVIFLPIKCPLSRREASSVSVEYYFTLHFLERCKLFLKCFSRVYKPLRKHLASASRLADFFALPPALLWSLTLLFLLSSNSRTHWLHLDMETRERALCSDLMGVRQTGLHVYMLWVNGKYEKEIKHLTRLCWLRFCV